MTGAAPTQPIGPSFVGTASVTYSFVPGTSISPYSRNTNTASNTINYNPSSLPVSGDGTCGVDNGEVSCWGSGYGPCCECSSNSSCHSSQLFPAIGTSINNFLPNQAHKEDSAATLEAVPAQEAVNQLMGLAPPFPQWLRRHPDRLRVRAPVPAVLHCQR